jgi:hypothetical protein
MAGEAVADTAAEEGEAAALTLEDTMQVIITAATPITAAAMVTIQA